MTASKLSLTFLHDDAAALAHLEAVLWPNGPTCPHCGATDRIYALKGESTRPGVRKCGHCRKPFTVKSVEDRRMAEEAARAAQSPPVTGAGAGGAVAPAPVPGATPTTPAQ